ncbi:porin [Aeoliella sp.]|uniref:porin n=1 Tax=Aeoliella sp. TaxID=2795800 RepID=UPI003CCB7C0C
MNVVKWTMGCALIAMSAGPALGQSAVQTAFNYDLTGYECGEPACGCEEPSCGCEDAGCCDSGCCGDSCCGDSCCSSCCCDSGCCLGDCLGDCCLGDPWALMDCIDPCGCCSITMGGWTQMGYHSDNTRLSFQPNDLLAFNDQPDRLNLHQQWLYIEKVAEAGACSADWGFRFDIMYGTDAQKTQSFGNDSPVWDASAGFDHGSYGWAMPQAYVEVASGDWNVIAGHFFTLVGYEVVTAPDNFFYSHAYTMFNSEPFTHTGVLATYSGLDSVELYGGWTAGWDTGFDQAFGGSTFLGGFSTSLTDDVALTYILTAGNFGLRTAGADGYSHSVVVDATLSDSLNYVFQSDLVSYNDTASGGAGGAQVGINQYLFYTMNDCWAAGARFEWWKSDGIVAADDSTSVYGLTYGLNYRPHANVVLRPEVRHNWLPAETAFGAEFDQTVFGVDCILTY